MSRSAARFKPNPMNKLPASPHSKPANTQKIIIGVLLLVAGLVILVLPNLVSKPWIADTSESVTPPMATIAITPSKFAENTQYRQSSQMALATIITVRDRLNDQSVELWADFEYRQAMALIKLGDDQYIQGNYSESLDTYKRSLGQFNSLEELGQVRLAQALTDGLFAIENASTADLSIAEDAARLAVAIDPDSQQAQMLAQRATVLPQVIEHLQAGDRRLASKQFEAAKSAYQQAANQDSQHLRAAEALDSIEKTIIRERFRGYMSTGFKALDQDNFVAANHAFNSARGLYNSDPAVAQALSQVTTRQSQIAVSLQMQEAAGYEKDERWSAALEIYQSLLSTDPSLIEVKIRTITVNVRADLDSQINIVLADPLKLASSKVYRRAQKLLEDARSISMQSPLLSRQIIDLDKVLRLSRTSVEVVLQSDNLTDVTLFRVKKFGVFEETSVSLKPGRYTVAGKRLGFRDVRIEFTITGEPYPASILVSCTEVI
jgi:hypothetical protein